LFCPHQGVLKLFDGRMPTAIQYRLVVIAILSYLTQTIEQLIYELCHFSEVAAPKDFITHVRLPANSAHVPAALPYKSIGYSLELKECHAPIPSAGTKSPTL
jgi:hypothetical protein